MAASNTFIWMQQIRPNQVFNVTCYNENNLFLGKPEKWVDGDGKSLKFSNWKPGIDGMFEPNTIGTVRILQDLQTRTSKL